MRPGDHTALPRLWHRLLGDERGALMAEYGLPAVLIGVFVMLSVAVFGDSLLGLFQDILDALPF